MLNEQSEDLGHLLPVVSAFSVLWGDLPYLPDKFALNIYVRQWA